MRAPYVHLDHPPINGRREPGRQPHEMRARAANLSVGWRAGRAGSAAVPPRGGSGRTARWPLLPAAMGGRARAEHEPAGVFPDAAKATPLRCRGFPGTRRWRPTRARVTAAAAGERRDTQAGKRRAPMHCAARGDLCRGTWLMAGRGRRPPDRAALTSWADRTVRVLAAGDWRRAERHGDAEGGAGLVHAERERGNLVQ